MMAGRHWLRLAALLLFVVVAANGWHGRDIDHSTPVRDDAAATSGRQVPAEAERTLQLIQRGGPFPYERDGAVFENRERRLPAQPRGYYREYTVPTPGADDRGARRIVAGGDPPRVFYYTDDHYRSFQRLEVAR